MKHFVGAMDIDGLGEENVRRFLSEELISDSADLYSLTAERLSQLEGFGEISAQQPRPVARSIEGSSPSSECSTGSESRAWAT